MMKKICILMIITIMFSLSYQDLSAQDKKSTYGKINFIIGDVKVKSLSGKRTKAKLNMKIYPGDKVFTGEKSSAQIIIKDGIKLRLAQKSEFEYKKDEISGKKKKKIILGLNVGKIWGNIKKLKKDQELSIETPTAVAGIRGTILVLTSSEEGSTLYVGEGLVNMLSKLIGSDINVDGNYKISIGKDGKLGKPQEMNEQDQKDMMKGIPIFFQNKQDDGEHGDEDSELKKKLKGEIDKEKENFFKQKQYAGRLKNEDLMSGRTLTDVHGNLVRVEQLFRKKGTHSLQIINLTQREDGLAYFDLTMKYNQELPANYSGWADFFVDNDDFKLLEQDAQFGTKRKTGPDDSFRWLGTYNANTDELDDRFFVNGTEYYGDMDDMQTIEEGSKELYSKGELTLYSDQAKTQVADKVYISIYIIKNTGEILSEKHFTSDNNVLNILNTSAGEVIIQAENLMHGTIDVVAPFDIAFVMIDEIL